MVDDDDDNVRQADGEGVQAEAGGPEAGVRGSHLPPSGGHLEPVLPRPVKSSLFAWSQFYCGIYCRL